MRKLILMLSVALLEHGICFAAGRAELPRTGIAIIRSDARSLVIEYTPEYLPPQAIESGNKQFVLYDFKGSSPAQNSESVGAPDLRYASLPVGFPSVQGNAVQVISADYEDIPNVQLAPVPSRRMKDELVEADVFTLNPSRYQLNRFQPSNVVELSAVSRSRSQIVGAVKIYPVQYNPVTSTVRRYSKIVVEVVFGSFSRPKAQVEDGLFDDGLVNAPVAKSWTVAPARPAGVVTVPSVLGTGSWYRLTVSEEGMYRLDAQYFSSVGINLQGIDPRTIKIYGNGGREIPENIFLPRANDLVENAIYVEGESDGTFNSGDYVLFYGRGARGFVYNGATRVLNHYINHYSEVNYYWLTFGGVPGRRMEVQPSLASLATVVPDRFRDGVAVEEEKVNFNSSGKDWYGQTILPGGSYTHANSLPGLVPNDLILYRYSVLARSNTPPTITVRETNGGGILQVMGLPIVFYDFDGNYAEEQTGQSYGTSSLPNNQSAVNFGFTSSSIAASAWINWLEVQYPRSFTAVNNYLRFRSPDTSGIVEYRLEQFTSTPFLFNVSKPDSVRRITGAVGSYTFRAQETGGQVSEYCAAAGSFRTPAATQSIVNQDLRGYDPADSVDFIIVTSREFRSTADRLKAYREQPAHGGLKTYVVEVDTIYNEFGGGIPDVTAIRDFLKYSYDKWAPRLRFVLFLGQPSYDYKGILGSRSSYVPTWQSANSLHTISSYCSDDYFVRFSFQSDYIGTQPFLVTGRVSARQPSEANLFLDKLMRYENQSARDPWKLRILYVGDDGWTPTGDEGTQHSQQAEDLARIYTPDEFEKKKIYIAEYPTVQTAQGRRKPAAYQAIIDAINRGALIVNFTGHGNPTVWTHESVFTTQTSIPALTNADRLSVYFGATCNFSQFDDPKRYTGSELLINKPDGGGIAVVSASRKVFGSPNAFLNQQTYARMFRRSPSGRLLVERPATALFQYKVAFGNGDNDQKFVFLGDPTMRLQFPEGYASIDSVNGRPRSELAQLKALSLTAVQGTILTPDDQRDSTLQGRMTLTINDASQTVVIVNFSPGINFSYLATGGAIYRGESSIANGMFTSQFVVPKDILYADSTSRGRVVAYYTSATGDGMGFTQNVWIGGTADSAGHDEQGPGINIFLDSRSFRSGDMVSRSPMLYVDLEDPNGINTSGSGIGHRIEAWINNSAQSTDLTDFYVGQLDNFRKGTVQLPLHDLPLGKNTIRVRAWDTYNNASTAETFFDVTSTDKLTIGDVMNYPNPFARTTAFTFRQNQLLPLNVTIKIYTLAGRLIQMLESFSPGEPFISVPWDGRDRDGDILANGVYLYKVLVRTQDGRFSSEALGKLAVAK